MPAELQAAPIEVLKPQAVPDTEVVRTLLACLVLGKERLLGFMTTDLRHHLTSIHAMDRSVSGLGDQGQGVVAEALTHCPAAP